MASLSMTVHAAGGIDKYPAKAHARRVAHRADQHKGIIILVGTGSSFFSHSDMPVPFRQDRYFYYLSGCNEPDCVISYDIANDWLTLYLPQISWKRFYYDGRGSTIKEAEAAYDIDEAKYIPEEASSALQHVLNSQLHPQTTYLLPALSGASSIPLIAGASLDFAGLQPAMDACRAVKDEHEIERVRKANEITAAAHKDVLLNLHKCHTEADAEAVYLKRCIASLAKEQAYEPIFGAGEDASYLHYIQDDKPFDGSQVLLIDAGCEWQRHASDVTRTIPLNNIKPGYWPSTEAENIYRSVERIQEQCIAMMKPGNRFSAVGQLAQILVVDELLQLGILQGDHDAILKANTHRAFLPHGLGHHIGLEVHDVAPPLTQSTSGSSPAAAHPGMPRTGGHMYIADSFSSTASEPVMEPGNIITVEPGIYFNKVVLERFFLNDKRHSRYINKAVLKRYLPVGGVRIEDDILITRHGHQNLTTAPKGDEALRIIREASQSQTPD